MPRMAGSASGWAHLDFDRIEAVTEKAVLVDLADWDWHVWIPLSLVDEPETFKAGQRDGTISVKEWWAEQNGLV